LFSYHTILIFFCQIFTFSLFSSNHQRLMIMGKEKMAAMGGIVLEKTPEWAKKAHKR
jgi:O-antigen/teichoic acid export membrane protein